MKKLLVAVVGACASLVSFGFDWTGKTGVVTLTETAEVTDADVETVAALDGIQLEGGTTDIIFVNTQPIKLSGYIRGDGTIVKRGTGDVTFGSPNAFTQDIVSGNVKGTAVGNPLNADYMTTKGIRVETGTLYLPQDATQAGWYPAIEIAKGATLFTTLGKGTAIESLQGEGTITNATVPVLSSYPKNSLTLAIGKYGSHTVSQFKGRIDGALTVTCCGEVHLMGTNSTWYSGSSVLCPTYSAGNVAQMHVYKFAQRKSPSSAGQGTRYQYGTDFDFNHGGKLFYHGEGNETSGNDFRWGMSYDYGAGWDTFDAGHRGGVTLSGGWSTATSDRMNGVVLTGSNTMDMVMTGSIKCYSNSDSDKAFFQIKKTGTGSWRMADGGDRTDLFGAWFVEEGTLKYDSIADVGETCSLGISTQCFPFQKHTEYAKARAEENRLPYEILLGSANAVPTFEFSSEDSFSSTTTRRIGLTGSGAKFVANNPGDLRFHTARVSLLGGVFAVDAGVKTLTLGGTNEESTVGNISDGQGKVNIVKEGAGVWRLKRDILSTGSLTVKGGTLSVEPEQPSYDYKWYKLVITKLGSTNEAHTASTDDDCPKTGNYYVRLRGIGLWTADGTQYVPEIADVWPSELMTEEQRKGSKSYLYPKSYWHVLKPGEVTIGDYSGNEYRTYSDSEKPGALFSNMKKTSHSVYNTYLGCTPSLSSPNAWLPIVFRLPDDAPAIKYYDVLMDQAVSTHGHVAAFKFYGSVDGEKWTELHTKDTCVHPKPGYWASSAGTVKFAVGQNCLAEGIGYAIESSVSGELGKYSTTLETVSAITVEKGATLQAVGEVELPKLTVDCAGEGVVTVKGFKIAETGVLTLANPPKGEVKLPVAFIDCEDLENLENWTAVVAGRAKPRYTITVSGGEVTLKPFGMTILIR